jgi:acetoin utilization deacetylase AcuC-like enzyme
MRARDASMTFRWFVRATAMRKTGLLSATAASSSSSSSFKLKAASASYSTSASSSAFDDAGRVHAPDDRTVPRPGADGRVPIVHHASYSKPVMPPGHRFPMRVFQTTFDALRKEGVALAGINCFTPARAPTLDELCAAHDETYVRAVCASELSDKARREIGLPWSDALVERTLMEVSGTMLTMDLAARCGLAVNTAGGTHHAHRARGSGFCIINDLAVSALRALESGMAKRVMIVDLDVHQGDGTAGILKDVPGTFTLSAHAASNFPTRKETSSRDVELPRGMKDDEYMAVVSAALIESMQDFKPDLVLYDAGVDVTANDSLGHLDLTVEGLYRRERMVLDTVLGAGIPLAGVVGGGYSPDIDELASRHAVLHRVAQEMFRDHGL